MNTIEAIMNRRSYRGRFSGDMVPKKDLEIILKAGLAAPSGCNKQTTSLIAIDKIVNPVKKPDEERYWFNTYGGYHFWGWEGANAKPLTNEYPGIDDPIDLYNALSHIWCAETCAPRMRDKWTKDNMTMGQCSITAFLAQDIFGGEVYGIPRSDGNYHCYNVIDDCRFDLTSEQFGDEVLDYNDNPKQLREVHFAKEEKRLRYEYLKAALKEYLSEIIEK